MSDNPSYVSPSTVKSLWQEYRIFADRLELDTLYGLISIPFEQIETIELRESDVGGLPKGDLQLRNFRPACGPSRFLRLLRPILLALGAGREDPPLN